MKYALVTGGSRGIGRAISLKLASMNYNILLNYKGNDKEAGETKSLIESTSAGKIVCELLKFDVSQKQATEETLGVWIDNNKEKQIEVLINNAGIRKDNLFMWMTD